mgnify:CR=1 FL=1
MKFDFKSMLSDIEAQDKAWRETAEKCADYYDHRQLTDKRLKDLESCERLPVIGNLIQPAINSVLGHEESARRDYRVVSDDVEGDLVAEALNQRLNEEVRLCNVNRYCSDAYKGMLIKGLDWLFVDKNPDPFGKNFVIERVPMSEVYYDMRGIDPEFNDWRWIARRKFMDVDQAKAWFPEHKHLVDAIKAVSASGSFMLAGEISADEEQLRTSEWTSISGMNREHVYHEASNRLRVAIYEVYYRVYERVNAYRFADGAVMDEQRAKQAFSERDLKAMQRMGLVEVEEATTAKIRRKWFIGPHEVDDSPSPHPHNYFPFVPFMGYREDKLNVPYGLVRGMTDAQDKYNEAEWEIQRIIESLQIFYNPKALADPKMTASDLVHELNRKDGVIPVSDLGLIRVERDLTRLQEMHARQAMAKDEIRLYSGIYESYSGIDQRGQSGRAINSLAALGSTTLAEINANYELARAQVGNLLLAYLIEEIGDKPVDVAVRDPLSQKVKKSIGLNKKEADGGVSNRIVFANYRVALTEATASPGNQQQAYGDFVDMFKVTGGNPVMQQIILEGVIKNSSIVNKHELLEKFEKLSGLNAEQDPQQQAAMQQEQLNQQQMAMQVEQARLQAEIEAKQAAAAREAAHSRLYEAQAALEIVKVEQLKQEMSLKEAGTKTGLVQDQRRKMAMEQMRDL